MLSDNDSAGKWLGKIKAVDDSIPNEIRECIEYACKETVDPLRCKRNMTMDYKVVYTQEAEQDLFCYYIRREWIPTFNLMISIFDIKFGSNVNSGYHLI